MTDIHSNEDSDMSPHDLAHALQDLRNELVKASLALQDYRFALDTYKRKQSAEIGNEWVKNAKRSVQTIANQASTKTGLAQTDPPPSRRLLSLLNWKPLRRIASPGD